MKNFVVARGNTKSQYCLELFEKEFKKNILELKRNRAFTKAVSNMAIMDIPDDEIA